MSSFEMKNIWQPDSAYTLSTHYFKYEYDEKTCQFHSVRQFAKSRSSIIHCSKNIPVTNAARVLTHGWIARMNLQVKLMLDTRDPGRLSK